MGTGVHIYLIVSPFKEKKRETSDFVRALSEHITHKPNYRHSATVILVIVVASSCHVCRMGCLQTCLVFNRC